LRVEASVGEDRDDGTKVAEEREDGAGPEDAALSPREIFWISLRFPETEQLVQQKLSKKRQKWGHLRQQDVHQHFP